MGCITIFNWKTCTNTVSFYRDINRHLQNFQQQYQFDFYQDLYHYLYLKKTIFHLNKSIFFWKYRLITHFSTVRRIYYSYTCTNTITSHLDFSKFYRIFSSNTNLIFIKTCFISIIQHFRACFKYNLIASLFVSLKSNFSRLSSLTFCTNGKATYVPYPLANCSSANVVTS